MKITRDQVLCLFCVEYNNENVAQLSDPKKLVLLPFQEFFADAFIYPKCPTVEENEDLSDNGESILINLAIIIIISEIQVINFINEVFLPNNPDNGTIYKLRSLDTNCIFSEVLKFTNIFEDTNSKGFAK
ncbi:unnamed protein product [Cunninghamella blakesleeana]